MFHEFGHAMHTIMTRANYGRFSGTSVPQDFVEAPSQMLENWAWDKKVLDSFAADYRDPTKKIPQDILGQLKESKLATEGHVLSPAVVLCPDGPGAAHANPRRQCGRRGSASQQVLAMIVLPEPPDSAFVAYFGHLIGYDAGYYGYAWADAIAADMATVFEKAPDGYFDQQRRAAFAPGDLRAGRFAGCESLHREIPGPSALNRTVPEENWRPPLTVRRWPAGPLGHGPAPW